MDHDAGQTWKAGSGFRSSTEQQLVYPIPVALDSRNIRAQAGLYKVAPFVDGSAQHLLLLLLPRSASFRAMTPRYDLRSTDAVVNLFLDGATVLQKIAHPLNKVSIALHRLIVLLSNIAFEGPQIPPHRLRALDALLSDNQPCALSVHAKS